MGGQKNGKDGEEGRGQLAPWGLGYRRPCLTAINKVFFAFWRNTKSQTTLGGFFTIHLVANILYRS